MDVTIDGTTAFAIGNRTLHVLNVNEPSKPRPIGKLGGQGRVRHIVVEAGFAYITSRAKVVART